MYPLRFQPIFKDYLWGGRRLHDVLGKETGAGQWAESWEIVDHDDGQSVVLAGPWAGKSLRSLLTEFGPQVVGEAVFKQLNDESIPPRLRGRFPLLLKFLDACRTLSVQVHPDDRGGAAMATPDLGKTEAWYVIDAEPDSFIYAGLKHGVSEDDFRLAVERGTTEEVLHRFQPTAGDCVFVRAGTVHAIGEGLLVCEIQQASNTTFRLFDWNRVGSDGKSRPLHIEQGLEAIDFGLGPVGTSQPAQSNGGTQNLVRCDKFVLNRWNLSEPTKLGGDGKFRILALISGELSIEGDPCEEVMGVGHSMLLPASCGPVEISPSADSTLLEIHLP